MKRGIVWMFVFMLAAGSSLAQPKTEQQVLDLSKKKFEWILSKQYDSLNWVLDDQVKYIHSNGWVQTKKEIIDDSKSGKLVYQKIDVKESAVRLYDKTAIVTGKGKFSGTAGSNTFDMELSYTEVYVKSSGHWLLASRHANKMP